MYDAAVKYVEMGYYWNVGIFMFKTEFFINEAKQYAENIYNAFKMSSNIKEPLKISMKRFQLIMALWKRVVM